MSYVYLIGPTDWRNNAVKIGVTRSHPLIRLAAFQTGCPVKLEVYGYFKGEHDLERLLHETFRPVHLHGEWFELDGRLLAFVGDIYGDTQGKRLWAEAELIRSVSDLVLSEFPPHPSFSSDEHWLASANVSALSLWLQEQMDAPFLGGEFQ